MARKGAERTAAQAHVQRPGRASHPLAQPPEVPAQSGRPGEARSAVAIATAGDRQVNGEHQGGAASVPSLDQQVTHKRPVADHVELKPERFVRSGRDLGYGTGRNRGEAEGRASGFGGSGRLNLAPPREEARHADWA